MQIKLSKLNKRFKDIEIKFSLGGSGIFSSLWIILAMAGFFLAKKSGNYDQFYATILFAILFQLSDFSYKLNDLLGNEE